MKRLRIFVISSIFSLLLSAFFVGHVCGSWNCHKTNAVSELENKAWRVWLNEYDNIKRLTKEYPRTIEDLMVLQGCACLTLARMATIRENEYMKSLTLQMENRR